MSDKIIIPFKATVSYRKWLKKFAKKNNMSISAIVEFSLAECAKTLKYKEPPARK